MDILVAHDRRTGLLYAREFGMDTGPRPPKVATRVEELRGHAPPTTFVYVNSDNGESDPDVLEELLILESMGCEVDWVGIENPRSELAAARNRQAWEKRQRETEERWGYWRGQRWYLPPERN